MSGEHPGMAASPPDATQPGTPAAATVGAIDLCYVLDGDPAGAVLVLVNGLDGQLVDWDDGLLKALWSFGFTTLRFDNRDAGLSSSGDERFGFDRRVLEPGHRPEVAYTLADMADDLVGLLDVLGVARAHLLGVSMGGMIVQTVAIRHPGRVLSLCSVMSTTGAPGVGQPTAEALAVLTTPAPSDRDARVAWEMGNHRVIGSPGFPADPAWLRARAERRVDRAVRPAGTARQMMAIVVAEDRTAALGRVTVPTLVVHGTDDPLVDPSGGRATAAAVPGAELVLVPGMGHDLPAAIGPWLAARVAANAARADERVAGPAVGPPPAPTARGSAEPAAPTEGGLR